MPSYNATEALEQLGQRLRVLRLERDETQQRFAARLGVSVPTYQKLESGHPSVSIGVWVEALRLLGRLSDLDSLLMEKRSLFKQYENLKTKKRRRASKRKPKNA